MGTREKPVQTLPVDESAEQGVLGAILLDEKSYDIASEEIVSTDFSGLRHGRIFTAMGKLRAEGLPIDSITLADMLQQQGQLNISGGRGYLADLVLAVGSSSQIKTHAGIVKKTKILRELIRLGTDTAQAAYEQQSPDEIVEKLTRAIFKISAGRQAQPWRTMQEVMAEVTNAIDIASKRDGTLNGWTTGLNDLDAYLGGLMPTDLILIGARPSMGKTALGCGIALSASAAGAMVGMVSLEMSRSQLGLRFLGYEGGVDISAMRSGNIRPDQWRSIAQASARLSSRLVWLDDSGYMTAENLRTKCRQLATQDGLDVLIVDYLQLMSGSHSGGRQQLVADISRELKLLAKELGITVIALSQLSRELERREDRRPILSDLRESGGLEQDADIVIFIYRDEIYNPETVDKGIAEIIIRKQRNGPTGSIRVAFQDQFARFDNLPSSEA